MQKKIPKLLSEFCHTCKTKGLQIILCSSFSLITTANVITGKSLNTNVKTVLKHLESCVIFLFFK